MRARVRSVVGIVAVLAAVLGLQVASPTPASAVTIFENITLQNSWIAAPNPARPPGVSLVSGVVHFKGAIAGGAASLAFTVPPNYRPNANVYVRVDLCNGATGRIVVTPAGDGFVEAFGSFANAQCRTSLEGASYAISTFGFTPLTLQNGWANSLFGTATAGAQNIGGIVHLQGAVTGGTSSRIAVLPPSLRPVTDTYIPVTLCNSSPGRLYITPTGTVDVFPTDGLSATSQCFTSLEGASFSRTGSGFNTVTLENGWVGGAFGTDQPGFIDISGVLHFKGAVASGTTGRIFTLPTRFRPTSEINIPVDQCNGLSGSLRVTPDGGVTAVAATNFSDAACFTSLEGASFALSNFVPLKLVNGWTPQAFGTGVPAVVKNGNVVSFTGAVAGGTLGQITTISAAFRPPTDVYVAIDLCGGANGRLLVQSNGAVFVQALADFADAQCFTSLEGASFVLPNAQTKLLTLQNGWVGSPFGTNLPRVQRTFGVVRFSGALSSGTAATAFTLPPAFRPATDLYLPLTLCNAAKGRLLVSASGQVQIFSDPAFPGAAACFTSLDGVEYLLTTSLATPVATLNSWQPTSAATQVVVQDNTGIIRMAGAVFGGSSDTIAVLPVKFRPTVDVYVPVDLCDGAKGRVVIQPSGDVRVFTLSGNFAEAQCFTSLESVSYAL